MATTTLRDGIEVKFSAGTDTESLLSPFLELTQPARGLGWKLTPQGNAIERTFKFKTFKKTWEFMEAVAKECAVKRHHPEWSNIYNTTYIRWTTHQPPGLSVKDIEMAKFCDEQAALFGELPQEKVEQSEGNDMGRELADRVAKEGEGCCVPKLKSTKT